MDIQPSEQKTQALSDDQELAKVLAGVNNDDDQTSSQSTDEPDASGDVSIADIEAQAMKAAASSTEQAADSSEPELTLPSMPDVPDADATSPSAPSDDLEGIKQEALGELRPLVDKLNVSAEEKFDTYLLLLRSTDDRELIAPAHEAAKAIEDEARKAKALLDIIKEIDFLSGNSQQQP